MNSVSSKREVRERMSAQALMLFGAHLNVCMYSMYVCARWGISKNRVHIQWFCVCVCVCSYVTDSLMFCFISSTTTQALITTSFYNLKATISSVSKLIHLHKYISIGLICCSVNQEQDNTYTHILYMGRVRHEANEKSAKTPQNQPISILIPSSVEWKFADKFRRSKHTINHRNGLPMLTYEWKKKIWRKYEKSHIDHADFFRYVWNARLKSAVCWARNIVATDSHINIPKIPSARSSGAHIHRK